MYRVLVHGVGVDCDNEKFKDIKNPEELKDTSEFEHLPENEKRDAEIELFNYLGDHLRNPGKETYRAKAQTSEEDKDEETKDEDKI